VRRRGLDTKKNVPQHNVVLRIPFLISGLKDWAIGSQANYVDHAVEISEFLGDYLEERLDLISICHISGPGDARDLIRDHPCSVLIQIDAQHLSAYIV
jgi:hypothetical protein